MSTTESEIGLIGLGVMGQNLALNIADHGFPVAVYNRTSSKTDAFVASEEARGRPVTGHHEIADLIKSLRRPRAIILMVKAGAATDAQIDALAPLLEPGDLIIDGGNAHYRDTIRRDAALSAKGLLFLGTGISGGEAGARHGPSIMPGGSQDAFARVADILTAIAAKVDGKPCCVHIGPDGAGHFVKMMHNGIEYADMQLIAEIYALMQQVLGLKAKEMQAAFAEWHEGDLDSYLIEITADILGKTDPETGLPLVDVILDRAGQKGTGGWAVQAAIDYGVPATAIAEAVGARGLSSLKAEREHAATELSGIVGDGNTVSLAALRDALLASKVCAYAQGFAVMAAASEAHGWNLDFGAIASIWRGGCIIRARFLDRIADAYAADPKLANLLLAPYFADLITKAQPGWRAVVAASASRGVPAPALASALAYFDGYRSARLPANLLQAQRDYFGAHTYERTDRPGHFHTDWTSI